MAEAAGEFVAIAGGAGIGVGEASCGDDYFAGEYQAVGGCDGEVVVALGEGFDFFGEEDLGAEFFGFCEQDVSDVGGTVGVWEYAAGGLDFAIQASVAEEAADVVGRELVEAELQEPAFGAEGAGYFVWGGVVGEVASAGAGEEELASDGRVGFEQERLGVVGGGVYCGHEARGAGADYANICLCLVSQREAPVVTAKNGAALSL